MRTSILRQVRNLNVRLKSSPFQLYRKVMMQLCQDYSHYSFTRSIHSALRAGDVAALVVIADSLAEQQYSDSRDAFVASQFSALIKKYPFPKDINPFDPEKTATTKFLDAEHRCLRVNQWFAARRRCRPGLHEDTIHKMRVYISYVLGNTPDIPMILDKCGFGPGASIGVHGKATNAAAKLCSRNWSVTPTAFHWAYSAVLRHAQVREALLPSHGGFSSGSPERDFLAFKDRVAFVEHNKITFVPKTVKVHRTIAVEPLLNGFLQKGVDTYMRLLLKRVGHDLRHQEPNQEYARLGSMPGQEDPYCTIDLAAASDSISTELVRELLPPDWFAFLNALRSKSYELNGERHAYHKFVSMGNGFCFPLETLIFSAACVAAGAGRPGRDFLVYGDDIVVRRSVFAETLRILKLLGFKANPLKTFSTGPFRESCGADYFEGKDIRPLVLDEELCTLQAIHKVLNMVLTRPLWSVFFSGVRQILLDAIPPELQFHRPYKGQVDTGLDPCGDDAHLRSPHCVYKRGVWSWRELVPDPVPYYEYRTSDSASAALTFGALSGSASAAPFTLRRETRTKVRVISHSGASSNWLPAYVTMDCHVG